LTLSVLADPVATLRAAGCVFAEEEAEMLASAAAGSAELVEMVDRRAEGLPLEQVVGWAELCGLRVAVEPGVFVPRQRTEALVREAAALLSPGAVVVDLCCGSGAVGAALAAAEESIELFAADVDPVAVRCARRNVERVYQGDLFAALPGALRGRVDLLAVNAPYVPSEDVALLPREARLYEPRPALDGGADGLDVLRRAIAAAPRWLAPAGRVVTEASEPQAPAVVEAARRVGLGSRVVVVTE
jgi:release factor glutamine methyltransferase